jgi:hypothetical protein
MSASLWGRLISILKETAKGLSPEQLRAEAVRVFPERFQEQKPNWLDLLAGFSETLKSPRYDQLRQELMQCPFPLLRSAGDTDETPEAK